MATALVQESDKKKRRSIQDLIDNPPVEAIKMEITMAVAIEMLEFNTHNRQLSEQMISHYGRVMTEGKWRLTRLPIIFDSKGQLQDGQHRLEACVKSGASFKAWVAFGEPPENFAYIDIGKKRSAADIFYINKVTNPHVMAAASRWLCAYQEGEFDTSRSGGYRRGGPEPDELYRFYMKHKTLQRSASFGAHINQAGLGPPSAFTGLHYVLKGLDEIAAEEFMNKLADGIGFRDRNDPVYRARNTLIGYMRALDPVPHPYLTACAIKAWNAVREEKNPLSMEWRRHEPLEPFPKAI